MNISKDYKLFNFPYIKKNISHFKKYANLAHQRFNFAYGVKTIFNQKSSTWFYRYYNITCLTFGSSLYYKLFSDLQKLIRKTVNHKKPLWYQSWLNFHKPDEVLNWHSHDDCILHGYISIDPKETETDFKEYKIKNKIGNIYIGKPNLKHKVNVLKPFNGHRITIAFDVMDETIIKNLYKKYGEVDINTGVLPVY